MVDVEVGAQIRAFLLNNPGQWCEPCLAQGAALDAKAIKKSFKPSRHNPYSFMFTWCKHCQSMAICVAYVGEPSEKSRTVPVAMLDSAAHSTGKPV